MNSFNLQVPKKKIKRKLRLNAKRDKKKRSCAISMDYFCTCFFRTIEVASFNNTKDDADDYHLHLP